MRQIVNAHVTKANVVEHLMLANHWEYYIIEAADEDGYAFALVVGDATEMGSVWMPELEPYILHRTDDLSDLLPPPQWGWADEIDEEWAPDAMVCKWPY